MNVIEYQRAVNSTEFPRTSLLMQNSVDTTFDKSKNRVVYNQNYNFKKRLVRKLFSVPFQYCVTFLALIYLTMSLYAYVIEMDYLHHTKDEERDITISIYLKIGKLALTTFFLIEVFLRVLFTGLARYWFSIWNVSDFLVVVSCLVVEGLFITYHRTHILSYDGYIMAFRVWYALRTIRQLDSIKENFEEDALKNMQSKFENVDFNLSSMREENIQMENDLIAIRALINRITQDRIRNEDSIMLKTKSSWQSFVPARTAIEIRNIHMKRILSSPSLTKKRMTLSKIDVSGISEPINIRKSKSVVHIPLRAKAKSEKTNNDQVLP